MEKYTLLRDVSKKSKNLMRFREEKSNRIIAEIKKEPLDIKISLFFVVIFIALTEYLRGIWGENFIPARPLVFIGVFIVMIWQFAGRGWDTYLYDPIVNRITHNGKIRIKNSSSYQIIDRGKKASYSLVIKNSSINIVGNTFFSLTENQPRTQDFLLTGTPDGDYIDIQCYISQTHVFSTRFIDTVNLQDDVSAIKETQIELELSNPTDRMLAFVVSTLIIFKFQNYKVTF